MNNLYTSRAIEYNITRKMKTAQNQKFMLIAFCVLSTNTDSHHTQLKFPEKKKKINASLKFAYR